MALPKIQLPTYPLTLPSTSQVVTFRPFIMREEKLLMMALEDGSNNAILGAVHDIVSACTDEKIDAYKSPLFDVQYAFLQIRAKSVGEKSDFMIQCGQCKNRVATTIDISKIDVERVEGHTRKIALSNTLGVTMKYPTIQHLDALEKADREEIYNVIADCIELIYDKEEVYDTAQETKAEILNFINNLPVSQFRKIQEFFETMPVLRYEHKFTCEKCQKANILRLEGIESFFV